MLGLPLKGESLFEWIENDGVGEPIVVPEGGMLDKSDRTKGWRARMFGNCMRMMSKNPASSVVNM